ncbi:MAG: PqqD family protein [Desulfofustis sp. PB-SRB1]|jgi:hypothetical protein|nr:PqqD family protein [Desulfofustis sp. PB-SRB1]MBM1001497.1 PqqD family protein [Desulfofustis sp. PB-SRB1]HBH29217.1 PqqD family protein [Desulfofustis sp.]HBH30568.1 PqqD family protein [Desulfofustis sp.]
MNDTLRPRITPFYVAERFDGELLLYSARGRKAIYLNETACAVWTLCGKNMNIGEIIEYLRQTYPDAQDRIRDDVYHVLEELGKKGAIDCVDG